MKELETGVEGVMMMIIGGLEEGKEYKDKEGRCCALIIIWMDV